MSDVVNYRRLRRIMPTSQPNDGINTATCVCLGIITLAMLGLYKRYRDKSHPQSHTSSTLWM